MKLYRLEATNEAGAKVFTNGRSIAEALRRFDNEYHRQGWRIEAYGASCSATKRVIIKSTFR